MEHKNNPPLKIKRRGEDGHRLISLRIKEETLEKVDSVSNETNYSRNELLNVLIEYALDNIEIE